MVHEGIWGYVMAYDGILWYINVSSYHYYYCYYYDVDHDDDGDDDVDKDKDKNDQYYDVLTYM